MMELPPLVALNEGHPLAQHAEISVEDLAPHPMVLLDLPLSADYFLSFFADRGLRPNIAERTRDMAVLRSLVANGFGYSIVNLRPLNDVAPDGRPLRFVPLGGNARAMKMGMLVSTAVERSQLHRTFLASASEWVRRNSHRLSGGGPLPEEA